MNVLAGLIPEEWQSGGKGLIFGLCVLGGAAVMFEIGHWAGAIEEREYWAPLEEPPKRGWWRGWRWIELHVVDPVRHRVRTPKRVKAPQALAGRHRQPPPDMQKAPTPEE